MRNRRQIILWRRDNGLAQTIGFLSKFVKLNINCL